MSCDSTFGGSEWPTSVIKQDISLIIDFITEALL